MWYSGCNGAPGLHLVIRGYIVIKFLVWMGCGFGALAGVAGVFGVLGVFGNLVIGGWLGGSFVLAFCFVWDVLPDWWYSFIRWQAVRLGLVR